MLHVQRITGDMCGDTLLPSVTDPLLGGWQLGIVGFGAWFGCYKINYECRS